MKPEIESDI